MDVIKGPSVLLLAGCLSACGTFHSRDISDNSISIHNDYVKTHCDEISHVYSGIQYDLCLLDSERTERPASVGLDPLWTTSIDFIISAIADTLILPYTIHEQVKKGNIEVVN